MELLPLLAGLFDIRGVYVVDSLSGKQYTMEKSVNVFVENV